MTAKLISGNEIAQQIREELKQETARLKEKYHVVPGLVTILVGENPASVSYVTAKQKTSKELGFYSIQDNQPANITEEQLLKLIDQYNRIPRSTASWCSFRCPNISTRRKSFMPSIPGKTSMGSIRSMWEN